MIMNKTLLKNILASALLLTLWGCKDPYAGQMFVLDDGDDTKITNIAYLEKHIEDYSLFLEFLDAADYYNALNDASTTVTLFAPDNEAMRAFMELKGISSFDELDREYSRQVVQVHVIKTSLSENSFIQFTNEGSISTPTLFGDYLTLGYGYLDTDVDDVELANMTPQDTLSIYINNMSQVREMAHQTVNGMVYRLGGVIRPLIENVVEKMKDYGEYKLFLEAIEAAGMTDLLEITADTVEQAMGQTTINAVNYTVFAVDDATYAQAGIHSLDELETWLGARDADGKTGISRSDSASVIHRYVSYHILDGANNKAALTYSADPTAVKTYDTRETGEIITLQTLVGQTFINGTDGCGFVHSDIKACNGYIHKIDGIMPIWSPAPSEVIWDFCNSPDIIALVNAYGADNSLGMLYSTPSDAAEYKIDLSTGNKYGTVTSFKYAVASPKSSWLKVGFWKIKANTDATLDYENDLNAYLNNLFIVNLGYTGWVEFKTPTLVKGKYRVEFYYAGAKALASKFYGQGSLVKFTLDDYLKNFYVWKGWDSKQQAVTGETLFEKVIFDKTSSHTLKAILMDANATSNANYRQMWDYIKFVPID